MPSWSGESASFASTLMRCISGCLLLLLLPAATLQCASRRALLGSALPVAPALLLSPQPAVAAGNTCATDDTQCLQAAREEAQKGIKENAGGFVGVAALLVLRGLGAPDSGLAVAQKRMRQEKLAKKRKY